MKTRILTAIVASAALLVVLFLPWPIAFTIAMSLVCAIAAGELMNVTRAVAFRSLAAASVIFAAVVPFFHLLPSAVIFFACLLYVVLAVQLYLRHHERLSLDLLCKAVLLTLLMSFGLSCASFLRTTASRADTDGLFYVMLSMVIAWMADSGAYFVGTFFGKHKLCPNISPKKTVEGLVGGIASSMLFSLLSGWIYQVLVLQGGGAVSYWTIVVLAAVGAPLSVIGDLFASLIKRSCGVKDFGKIFPGHGGMMDRFDSLMLVFPLVYLTVRYLPIVY